MSNSTTTAIGRVQPLYKGTYSATTTYSKLDNVYANGNTYISLSDDNYGYPVTDNRYWQLVAAKGDTGAQGITGSFGTPTAEISVLDPGEAPTVNVTASGPDTAKIFAFDFGIPVGVDYAEAQATTIASTESASASVALVSSGDSKGLNFSFAIPRGAAGSGSVSTVDSLEPDSGNGNVDLTAVRYGTSQELSEAQKLIARRNIAAVQEPDDKSYGAFLQYAGNVSDPYWVATSINQVPSGGTTSYVLRKQTGTYGWTPVYEIPTGGSTGAVLCKVSETNYDYGWSPVISSSDIDSIVDE